MHYDNPGNIKGMRSYWLVFKKRKEEQEENKKEVQNRIDIIYTIYNLCYYTMISLLLRLLKHANSEVQKPPSQLLFSLPSIMITLPKHWTLKHKFIQDRLKSTNHNHKPWLFEPIKVKFCFLRCPLRWLTPAKNANVSWLLNFGIRVFLKSAITRHRLAALNVLIVWLFPGGGGK